MSYRGQFDDLDLNLDAYGDGDEATLRRSGVGEAELEYYDEDEAPTLPWMRQLN